MTTKSGYIAILGEPNAGKSTLLNSLLGEHLSIVSKKPQTTRKRFLGILTTEKAQMIFLDTPGIHASDKLLNKYMHSEIDRTVDDADILCFLLPVDNRVGDPFKKIYQNAKKNHPDKPRVIVLNKMDIDTKEQTLDEKWIGQFFEGDKIFKISAKNTMGLPFLMDTLLEYLPEGPFYYDAENLTDSNMRDIVAEIVREKIFESTFDEIPYGCMVLVDSFKETDKKADILVTIIVDQDSQKGILIGKGGLMIKKIGTKARESIGKLLGKKVMLETHVKVDKNWTKDATKIGKYGYK